MTVLPAADIDCSIEDEVCSALRPDRWMTHVEVHRIIDRRWSVKAVRQCLRDMHESSRIEGRIGGTDGHKVREYRAWR